MGPPHLERGAGRALGGSRLFWVSFDYQLPAVRHVVAPSLGLEAPQRRIFRLPALEGEVQEQRLAPSLGPEAPQRCSACFPRWGPAAFFLWFSSVFISFHKSSLVFIGFHRFS